MHEDLETSGSAPNMNIRDLVNQVKKGELDKNTAFNNLQAILHSKQESAEGKPEEDGAEPQFDPDEDAHSSSTGKMSQEDRRMLINKLIEKKRQDRSNIDEVDDAFGERAYDDGADDGGMGGALQYHNGAEYQEDGWNQSSLSYFTRHPPKDSYSGHDARTNRIAQAEAAIRHEMFKDCTFRPQIKGLPSYYGAGARRQQSNDTNFNDRVSKWQREKLLEQERKKTMTKSEEVEDCTFKPKLNANSVRAVKEIRGNDDEDASERLYKNHELSILQKTKFIEEELSRERELEVKECTFQPNLHHGASSFTQVRSKVSSKPKEIKEDTLDPTTYTFAPKVKGITRNMASARTYASTNVVERLTRPLVTSPEGMDLNETFDKPAIDVQTFMGTMTPGAKKGERPKSAPHTGTGKKMKTRDVDRFLGRMEQSQLRRQARIEQTTKAVEHKFQPRLCKKSIELSSRTSKGEFLERVERDVLSRNDHALRAAVSADEKCTFAPHINTKSEKMRGRTVFEMSRGDMLKRDTTNRMMRLRSDQEELSEMTFKPEITTRAKKINETKKVSIKDTDRFLEMAKEKAQRKEGERLAELERRERAEIESCTFAPQTKECPAYVRRIAKSMAVVRAARANDSEPMAARPTWK